MVFFSIALKYAENKNFSSPKIRYAAISSD